MRGDVTVRPGLTGYLAEPAGSGPGVLVVHDWYGLLPGVKAACDALAKAGFVAFAPDLYQGRATTDPGQAEELMEGLDVAEARERLALGAGHLRGHRRVGAAKLGSVAWSMGGSLALGYAASGQLDAVVVYYATAGPARAASITCPVLLHLAEVDDWAPDETPEAFLAGLRAAGTIAEARTWPGTEHSFANPDVALYEPDAAALAWVDTVAFLDRHLHA
jgi:carboxymethylenebutenolidase